MDERQASLLVIGVDSLEKDQIKGLVGKYADQLDGVQIVDFQELPEDTQEALKSKKAIEIQEPVDLSMCQVYHDLASSAAVLETPKVDFNDTPFYKKIHQKGGRKNKRNRWPR